MGHSPTWEQMKVLDEGRTGSDMVIEAGAGTGKTSTLLMLANDNDHRRGVYLAYNAATAREARNRFPASVECKTAHAIAMRAVGHRYERRLRMPRQPGREAAEILGIRGPHRVSADRVLAPWQVASIVIDTVGAFCTSADPEPAERHVPLVRGMEDSAVHAVLGQIVVPFARRAWEDMRQPDDARGGGGSLRVTHDAYLKVWQLSGPVVEGDLLLYDEAQDADPAVADVVGRQDHMQRVYVGDRSQSLYQWRGAIDAMSTFKGTVLTLSQSFRFGPAVAAEANVWLDLLDASLRLTGHDAILSTVGPLQGSPRAVLCRTNAQALSEAMTAVAGGARVALGRGQDDIKKLAESAISLKEGRGARHRDLIAFRTWGEVQLYVEEEAAGSDLKVFVELVDRYTPEVVLGVLESLCPEEDADMVALTAHNAKGREWDTVRIAPDFREPDPDRPLARPELMLAYVAVTRAKRHLDPLGVEWVHDLVPASAGEEAAV